MASALARRMFRPATAVLDRRITRISRKAVLAASADTVNAVRAAGDDTAASLRATGAAELAKVLDTSVTEARRHARREVEDLHDALLGLRQELADTRGELAALREESFAARLLLDPARTPTAAQFQALADEVRELTGDTTARQAVSTAFRTLMTLESLDSGTAGDAVPDILGKLASVPLLAPPNGEVLALGALKSLFTDALARQLRGAGLDSRVTSAARAPDAVHRYGVVVISPDEPPVGADGDGGGRDGGGLAADLARAERETSPGGVVIVNDYGGPSRADVRESLAERLTTDSRLVLLGQVSTSAFLRAR